MNILEVRKLLSNAKTPAGYSLSETSIRGYISKLNKASNLTTGKDYKNYQFLLNPKKVINAFNNSDLKNVKDYYSPIINILELLNVDKKIISQYKNELINKSELEYKNRQDNKLSDKDIQKLLSMSEINNRYNNFNVRTPSDLMDKLIVAFYFKNNLIPRNNLYSFKISNSYKNLDKNFNYIIVDKNMNPIEIIMQNYKTSKTYGKQHFNITDELKELLTQYFNIFNKKNNDFLFSTDSGLQIKDNSFLYVLKKAMIQVLQSPLNVDLIRSIIINDFYTGKPKSINEKKEFARRLLHSPSVSQEYIFVNQ